jgi:hypothetical protein
MLPHYGPYVFAEEESKIKKGVKFEKVLEASDKELI